MSSGVVDMVPRRKGRPGVPPGKPVRLMFQEDDHYAVRMAASAVQLPMSEFCHDAVLSVIGRGRGPGSAGVSVQTTPSGPPKPDLPEEVRVVRDRWLGGQGPQEIARDLKISVVDANHYLRVWRDATADWIRAGGSLDPEREGQ